jgi:hypothetical protein
LWALIWSKVKSENVVLLRVKVKADIGHLGVFVSLKNLFDEIFMLLEVFVIFTFDLV